MQYGLSQEVGGIPRRSTWLQYPKYPVCTFNLRLVLENTPTHQLLCIMSYQPRGEGFWERMEERKESSRFLNTCTPGIAHQAPC